MIEQKGKKKRKLSKRTRSFDDYHITSGCALDDFTYPEIEDGEQETLDQQISEILGQQFVENISKSKLGY